MTEELCGVEVSQLAKKKGFDEVCMNYWEYYLQDGKPPVILAHVKPIIDFREVDFGLVMKAKERPGLFNPIFHPMKNSTAQPWIYARPTQDLLTRWLREKHNINLNVYPNLSDWQINVYSLVSHECLWHSGAKHHFKSREEAMELGLLTALKRILP